MKNRILFALPLIATLALPMVAQQSHSSNRTSRLPRRRRRDYPIAAANPDQQLEPLKADTHEGFWGHLNPFARKKYVQRQLAPIRDRANELDDLTAANARMLKTLMLAPRRESSAPTPTPVLPISTPSMPPNRAQMANQSAQQASTQLHSVSQVVENLDQYQSASQIEIRFRPGATVLSKSAKEALDQLADSMKDQKGYLVEVQGFTPGHGTASIQHSQNLADSVVRYLVIDHQIPVYRISELGLGNATVPSASGEETAKPEHGSRVEVTLLKNGVDQLQTNQQASSMSQPQ